MLQLHVLPRRMQTFECHSTEPNYCLHNPCNIETRNIKVCNKPCDIISPGLLFVVCLHFGYFDFECRSTAVHWFLHQLALLLCDLLFVQLCLHFRLIEIAQSSTHDRLPDNVRRHALLQSTWLAHLQYLVMQCTVHVQPESREPNMLRFVQRFAVLHATNLQLAFVRPHLWHTQPDCLVRVGSVRWNNLLHAVHLRQPRLRFAKRAQE